jgi:two-component system OmpR family response regulator
MLDCDWSSDVCSSDLQTNVIDVHISRLRSKIDKGRENPLLHTIRGAGYMIRDGVR